MENRILIMSNSSSSMGPWPRLVERAHQDLLELMSGVKAVWHNLGTGSPIPMNLSGYEGSVRGIVRTFIRKSVFSKQARNVTALK